KVAGIEFHELPERVASRPVVAAPALERADLLPDLDAVGIALENGFEHTPGLVESLAITQIGRDLDLHPVMGRIEGRCMVEMGAGAVMVTATTQEPCEVQANPDVIRRAGRSPLQELFRLLEGGPVAQQRGELEQTLNMSRIVGKDAPEHR